MRRMMARSVPESVLICSIMANMGQEFDTLSLSRKAGERQAVGIAHNFDFRWARPITMGNGIEQHFTHRVERRTHKVQSKQMLDQLCRFGGQMSRTTQGLAIPCNTVTTAAVCRHPDARFHNKARVADGRCDRRPHP